MPGEGFLFWRSGDDKGSARLSSSEQGRPPYSDPDSDSASYRSSEGAPYARGEGSPCLRLDAMQPQVRQRPQQRACWGVLSLKASD